MDQHVFENLKDVVDEKRKCASDFGKLRFSSSDLM